MKLTKLKTTVLVMGSVTWFQTLIRVMQPIQKKNVARVEMSVQRKHHCNNVVKKGKIAVKIPVVA